MIPLLPSLMANDVHPWPGMSPTLSLYLLQWACNGFEAFHSHTFLTMTFIMSFCFIFFLGYSQSPLSFSSLAVFIFSQDPE